MWDARCKRWTKQRTTCETGVIERQIASSSDCGASDDGGGGWTVWLCDDGCDGAGGGGGEHASRRLSLPLTMPPPLRSPPHPAHPCHLSPLWPHSRMDTPHTCPAHRRPSLPPPPERPTGSRCRRCAHTTAGVVCVRKERRWTTADERRWWYLRDGGGCGDCCGSVESDSGESRKDIVVLASRAAQTAAGRRWTTGIGRRVRGNG